MAEPQPSPDCNGSTGDHAGSTPRWVKVFGIIASVLVLLFVILHLTGAGHDPSTWGHS